MNKSAALEDAISIAALAHKGEKEKAGAPYILHPLRILSQMKTEEEMIAAVLHDVVEDSEWTIEQLRLEGFSIEVLKAVECLTHKEGEVYDDYIGRVATNPIARRVKLADLEDNMNIQRIASALTGKDFQKLEKYHNTWRKLSTSSRA